MSISLDNTAALVVLSGGQDSVTCLHWALNRYDRVHALILDYGQRHAVEVQCAEAICVRHDVPYEVADVPLALLTPHSALTQSSGPLANAFLPARNLIFLTLAAAHAVALGARDVVTGVCQADHTDYPDCRASTIAALTRTINLGLGVDDSQGLIILAPLMDMGKAGIFAMAQSLGVLDEIIEDTHTCYAGDRSLRHAWGYGCGECSACSQRRSGYLDFTLARREA